MTARARARHGSRRSRVLVGCLSGSRALTMQPRRTKSDSFAKHLGLMYRTQGAGYR